MATDDPEEQKSLGRSVRGFVDSVWKANAEKIALRANVAKYGQNVDLGQRLAATGARRFVEGYQHDRIWGVGLLWSDPRIEVEANWRGLNLLGATIDETRRVLALRLEHGVATRGIDAV
jgi:ribA/ribD-fused uncharacterized protein